MDPRHFPPSLQRIWADEVLFLHSLWRRGPPQNPYPKPSPIPNPNPSPIRNSNPNQRPFKRRRRRKSKDQAQPSNPPASEIEWPVNPSPDRDAEPAGWPEPAPNPNPRPPVSAAEQARVSATLVQQTAVKSSRAFFSKDGSDDDEMNEDEDDDEEEESRALEFFVGVFDNDEKLRKYYAKNYEKGDFFCLVCEGIRVKLGRRYVDCVGLVQHSSAISKTKRIGAHRGFGHAVCRVLGWDIKRLPNIILDRGEPMGDSLVKEGKMQVYSPDENSYF